MAIPETVPTPSDEPRKPRRICAYDGCRKKFVWRRKDQRFCSKACRYAYHNFGPAFGSLSKQGVDRLVKMALVKIEQRLARISPAYVRQLLRRVEAVEQAVARKLDASRFETEAALKQRARHDFGKRIEKLESAVRAINAAKEAELSESTSDRARGGEWR